MLHGKEQMLCERNYMLSENDWNVSGKGITCYMTRSDMENIEMLLEEEWNITWKGMKCYMKGMKWKGVKCCMKSNDTLRGKERYVTRKEMKCYLKMN